MKPFSTFSERAGFSLRMAVPYGLMVALFFMGLMAVPYPFGVLTKVPFFIMAIYYWSIYRPTLVAPWLVFAAGMVMDVIGGFALGFNALIFVILQWFITDQRRFLMGQPFIMVWVGFVFACGSVLLVEWGLFSLLQFQYIAAMPLLFSFLLGVTLFPFVSILLHMTHKVLPFSAKERPIGVKR